MSETWKDINEFEGIYQVSNLGRVRSLDREDSIGRKRKGRVLNQASSMGYAFVNLSKDGQMHVIRVHRLVAEAFIGPCPNGYTVNHIDCVKSNNRADNLEYMTQIENIRHAIKNGRYGTLSVVQVQAIRYIYQRNRRFPIELIVSKFEVSPATVINVLAARTYADIPNIDGSPVTPLDDILTSEAALMMREAGFEAREIAMALALEYSTAFQCLNRAGIHLTKHSI